MNLRHRAKKMISFHASFGSFFTTLLNRTRTPLRAEIKRTHAVGERTAFNALQLERRPIKGCTIGPLCGRGGGLFALNGCQEDAFNARNERRRTLTVFCVLACARGRKKHRGLILRGVLLP